MTAEKLRDLILGFEPELEKLRGTNTMHVLTSGVLRIRWLKGVGMGFAFYSDIKLNKPEHFIGPWLKERLTDCFSPCGFTKVCFAKRGGRMGADENAVEASCVEVSFDLDELNKTGNGEALLQEGLDKARCFLDKEFKVKDAEDYNKKDVNRMEIERYENEFGHRRGVSPSESGGDKVVQDISPESLEGKVAALLKSNLQVILTGAPGTGKTFTAKKVAFMLTGDNENTPKEQSHIQSVQCHPGYDYSDFVIGMKPVLVSDDGKEVFKDAAGFLYTTDDGKKDGKRTPFFGKTNVSFEWKDGIFKKFADKARQAYDKAENKEQAPKFVFIIDEINRADLSRVFGELFSLLEEEYRYPQNKKGITLPNGETFHIPANLYIIGTMNDIDRSVESMDFALRRRFAWKEVRTIETAEDILENKKVPSKDALMSKMKAVNAIIEKELGPEYELGAALFAKYGKCKSFDMLWTNHIEIILKEYLRGRKEKDRDTLLKELKEHYDTAVGIQQQQRPE